MQGRIQFVEELVDTIQTMISDIEQREVVEPDLAVVRELAEQLKVEIEELE